MKSNITRRSAIKTNSIHKIIRYCIFLSAFAFFATLAPFQEGAYDSDGVFFHLFYEDIFQNGGDFFAWKFGPGMSVNLELIIRCAAAFLSNNNIAISSIIDTFLQAVLLFFAMNFLFKELMRTNDLSFEEMDYHPYPFSLFFIALACMYSGVTLTGIFNYYIPSDITLSFLILTFFIKFYKTLQNKHLLLFQFCLAFAVFGSRKFFFFFAVPLLATLIIFLFYTYNDPHKKKVITKSLIFALLAILIADQILIKIVAPNFAGTLSYLGTQASWLTKLNNFIEEITYLLDKGRYFHAPAILIFLSALIFLFFKVSKVSFSILKSSFNRGQNEVRNIDFLSAFLIILVMMMACTTIIASFIFTSFDPSKEIRYYSVFRYYSIAYVWLLCFVTFRITKTKLFCPANYYKLNCLGFLFVFLVSILFFLTKDQLKGYPVPLKSVISYDAGITDMENASCIDDNKEKYYLDHGISNFWMAQSVTAMSKKKIRVNQVGYGTDLLPYYWQNNKEWFVKGVPGSGKPNYNFIILSKKDPESRERVIRQKFGKETALFECSKPSSINKVLVYSGHTNFDARLKHFWKNSPNSIFSQAGRQEWLFYATELEINNHIYRMLEFNDTTLSTIENITPIGLLTYGPYIKDLEKGNYQITLKYSINNIVPGEPALKWDILINMEDVIAGGEIIKEEEGGTKTFIYRFSLKQTAKLFEFRIYLNSSKAKVTLTSLKLNRILNDINKNVQQGKQ